MPTELPQRSTRGYVPLSHIVLAFVAFNIVVVAVALASARAHLIPKSMFDSRGARELEGLSSERFNP